MRVLLQRVPQATVTIKTTAPRRLFERALTNRFDVIELECDAGMVQIDSLNVDVPASLQRARAFQRSLPRLVDAERAFLEDIRPKIVIGDIPPLAVAAAAAARVPALVIGNFTWDWIYEGYPEESPGDLVGDIRRIYQGATRALRLPLACGFAGLEGITADIPFIARESQRSRDEVRQILGLSPRSAGKPLVLISFGGYGVKGMNTAALGALKDYTVATTDIPTKAHQIQPAPGILYISEEQLFAGGLKYQDLVRAADVVATKPGYGIVSDALANGAALLYSSRGRFPEYEILVREMPRYVRAQFIEQGNLLSGNWAPSLETLLAQPPPAETPALNGAEVAVDEILQLAPRQG